MSRADRHRQVTRLKAEGFTFREIAAQLGLSMSTVTDVYYDPDGEKARARKRRTSRPCARCGRPVFDSGSMPPEGVMHLACRTEAARENPVLRSSSRSELAWSDQNIIDALRSCADSTGALTPKQYADEYARRAHGSIPSIGTVQHRFGGWLKALDAAGLHSPTTGRKRGPQAISREECYAAVQRMWDAIGRPPTYTEYAEYASATGEPSGVTVRVRARVEGLTWLALLDRLGRDREGQVAA